MKWIVRLAGLLVVVVIVLVGAVFLIPTERLARIATDQLSAATGRDVAINGDVSITLWPVLGVSADQLVVGNAEWAAPEPMFEAENAAIGVDALGLLRGDVRITKIEARSPAIRLAQQLNGQANWQFDGADSAAPEPSADTAAPAETTAQSDPGSISIERIDITNATLTYDAEGSDIVALRGVDVSLDWPDPSGAAEIKATLSPAGSPVNVDLSVGAFAAFIAGEVSPLKLTLQNDNGRVALDGRASTEGAVAGSFSLSTPDTDSLLRALGLPEVGLPSGFGQKIDASADVTLTPDQQIALRGMRLDLGGNNISGALDASFAGGTPQINAQLDAGALDVSMATETTQGGGGGSSGGNGQSASDTGWSTTPIDASGLAAFNGEIALRADSIDLGTFELGQTQVVLRNDNSRMVFELREVAAYGGKVTGEFVANNRSGLSVGGNMTVSAIQMQPLLRDAIDLDRLTGQGDLQLSFLGAGSNVDAIVRSLSGDGRIAIGRGTIEGIDLDALLRGGSSGGTTIFDDLTASWTISKGILSSQDLLFQLKNYSASGAGVVGLGTQTIDYRFTPVALRANSGDGLAIPVIFKGPWSDISIRPDLEAAIGAKLDEEKEAIEARAKEKLNEELGIGGDSGGSIEDEVKDKLLRKLFD